MQLGLAYLIENDLIKVLSVKLKAGNWRGRVLEKAL